MTRTVFAVLLVCLIAAGLAARLSTESTNADAAEAADVRQDVPRTADAQTPEENAVRALMRHEKARIDGSPPPAAWPEKVRRVGSAWVVDIDTRTLPGGYPEQIVVEVTTTGGHTGRAKR